MFMYENYMHNCKQKVFDKTPFVSNTLGKQLHVACCCWGGSRRVEGRGCFTVADSAGKQHGILSYLVCIGQTKRSEAALQSIS